VVISILHDAYQGVLAHEIQHPSLTVYMKITQELARRKKEIEDFAEREDDEVQGKKSGKRRMMLRQDSQQDDTKRRLGWVPTEERHWAPFAKDGASPDTKQSGTKSFA